MNTPHQKVFREPSVGIPPTAAARAHLRAQAAAYVAAERPVPPLPLADLQQHADRLLASHDYPAAYRNFAAILINNETWREQLAAVPFERRLLLLPKCLRDATACRAPIDEFGLVCQACGRCEIHRLQEEAERLGYVVLVAEGSALVMSIIQTGRIEAMVGVSCMHVLEKAFGYMESAAIPGAAIPLLQDGCVNTTLDMEWLLETLRLSQEEPGRRMDLESIRRQVDGWFTTESLAKLLGPPEESTSQLAQEWLGKAGKRWRPFLAASVCQALCDDADAPVPETLAALAVAVECFHKASLVHDDIEDADATRYGEPTLHAQAGIPVALNVGDLLIGEGYRMIAAADVPLENRAAMLRVAADGHHALCLGQGAELSWARARRPLSVEEVLAIFRKKTAPAFEVALRIGALYRTTDPKIQQVLRSYSEALGAAYQIRDDLEDFARGPDGSDLVSGRPNIVLALAWEHATGDDRTLIEQVWRGTARPQDHTVRLQAIFAELAVESRAQHLYDASKQQAIRVLADLEGPNLKALLRRVIGKIFREVEVQGWCREFAARNAPDGAPRAQAAG